MTVEILIGDVFDRLATIADCSIDCVVTSPPYWGLRDYDVEGQIGLEPTLGQHLDVMVRVFREVRRVLKPLGTLWLNYGDCYAAAPNGRAAVDIVGDDRTFRDKPFSTVGGTLKPKDLCMIPNRLAIALQDDGWWVRSEIIWHKPNPMPESVYDRPTSAHEKVWLLTKGEEYFYDHEAIREPVTGGSHRRAKARGTDTGVGWGHQDDVAGKPRGRDRIKVPGGWDTKPGAHGTINRSGRTSAEYADLPGVTPKSAPEGSNIRAKGSFHASTTELVETRNARNVWTIAPKAFREAHFATFPPALAERCILAGTPVTVCGCCGAPSGCGPFCELYERVPGKVLDPFGGAGTVSLVAEKLKRDSVMIELNPDYAEIAQRRIFGTPSVVEVSP
jgi:DNA modification methylase